MQSIFKIKSLPCAMCNNQALKQVGALRGVFGANIDRINNILTIEHTDEIDRDSIENMLMSLDFIEE